MQVNIKGILLFQAKELLKVTILKFTALFKHPYVLGSEETFKSIAATNNTIYNKNLNCNHFIYGYELIEDNSLPYGILDIRDKKC